MAKGIRLTVLLQIEAEIVFGKRAKISYSTIFTFHMIVDSRQADLFLLFSVNEQQTQVCSFNILTSLAREGRLQELAGNTGKSVKFTFFPQKYWHQKSLTMPADIAQTRISNGT